MQKLIQSFKSRNITAHLAKNAREAKEIALQLIPKSSVVGFGGSLTLEQIGLLDELRQKSSVNEITLLDRTKATPETVRDLYSKIFAADIFLSGTNAFTESGELVNVDGNGNRVAAIIFGPKKVIIITGKNKMTKDVDSALERVRKVAMPKNLDRLKTKGWDAENIWGQISIIERQKDPNRMHIIIVDEELGF